jgi:hypothetical protein
VRVHYFSYIFGLSGRSADVCVEFLGGCVCVDELTRRTREAASYLSRCSRFMGDLQGGGNENADEDDDLRRAQSKTERGLERLRRAAVKLLDTTPKEKNLGLEGVKQLLVGIVEVHEGCVEVGFFFFRVW